MAKYIFVTGGVVSGLGKGINDLYVGFEPEFYLFKLNSDGSVSTNCSDCASYFDLSPYWLCC